MSFPEPEGGVNGGLLILINHVTEVSVIRAHVDGKPLVHPASIHPRREEETPTIIAMATHHHRQFTGFPDRPGDPVQDGFVQEDGGHLPSVTAAAVNGRSLLGTVI